MPKNNSSKPPDTSSEHLKNVAPPEKVYLEEETYFDSPATSEPKSSASSTKVRKARQNKIVLPNSEKLTILTPIAEGGHGTVWEGIQVSLRRRLAIKSLKTNESSDSLTANLFRQEALTTAYLEHPNIIPVHDLGEDSEGRPLLAMKIVEGKQWNESLSEDFTKFSVRDFLSKHISILISVAQAVAFAHSKGIIHRDLKPPQVMLGQFGEVLLMDWGLAMATDPKLLQADIALGKQSILLNPVNPAGTPGYMAPEQTETNSKTLGTWTDVYLLGAVLYEILTGFKPHRPSKGQDILEAARKNAIIPPEELVHERDIPVQLSRLAMEAMSTRIEERTKDVETFIRELQDYLKGSDIRHESMKIVTEVANSIVSGTNDYTTLAYALDQLERSLNLWPTNYMAMQLRSEIMETFARRAIENNDINLAKVYTTRLKNSPTKTVLLERIKEKEDQIGQQKEKLDKAISLAEAEKSRAEVLVRFLIGELNSELRSIGRLDLIHRVAEESLQYFNSLSDAGATPETLYNRAISYMQIADVQSEQGKRQEAEETYYKSHELARLLVNLDSISIDWKILLADTWNRLGRLHFNMGRIEDASIEHNEAMAVYQEIRTSNPLNKDIHYKLCKTLMYLAGVEWRAQKLKEAHIYSTKALAIARELDAPGANNIEYRNCIANCLNFLSKIESDMGKLDGAFNFIYESLALKIALSEEHPSNITQQDEVLWTRLSLAFLLYQKGSLEESLETLRSDLPQRRRLYEQEPTNVMRLGGLAYHLSTTAQIFFLLGRIKESEACVKECGQLTRHLVKIDPSNPNAHASLAKNYYQQGEILALSGNWEKANNAALNSIEKSRYAWWMAPTNVAVIIPLAFGLTLHARSLRKLNQYQDSVKIVNEVYNLLSPLETKGSQAEINELRIRLELLTEFTDETIRLIQELRSSRHISPFLKQWLDEYELV